MTFPIMAIALFCILATALLLVIYYFVLTKCCLNLQQTDPLRLRSLPTTPSSPAPCHILGLSQTLIRKIPTLHYTKQEGEKRALFECAVCLSDFETHDPLRVLPKCGHGFHLDCIDVWLQSNANCPLCRACISRRIRSVRHHRLLAPASSPNDEEYVVMELGENNRRKCRHGSMMGDEGIEVRANVIRRSFSMDSVADRSVYLASREAAREGESNGGEGSRSRRVRRSFFSFGQGGGSSILPVEF